MTALTPQQMRELAGQLRSNADAHQEPDGTERRRSAAALVAAADQLEAVQEAYEDFAPWCVGFFGRHEKWPDGVEQHLRDLRIALTADTAPQEDRDAVYSGSVRSAVFECAAVFPGDLLGPLMYCRKRKGHTGEHNADGMRWLR